MAIKETDIALAAGKLVADDPVVQAIVGDRVRPNIIPQDDEMPAISIELVSQEGWHSLAGGTTACRSRLQFNCIADSKADSVEAAQAVLGVLDGYRGAAGQIFISSSVRDNQYDLLDNPTKGADDWRFRRVIDFSICHSQP